MSAISEEINSKNIIYKRLFLEPLWEQKYRLVSIFFSLIALSITQGLFLVLVGPFLKALFGVGLETGYVDIVELVPKNALLLFPKLSSFRIEQSYLIVAIPSLMLIAGFGKCLFTYFYQLNQQAVALYVAKRYRQDLFKAILSLPFVKIAKRSPAKWMSIIMNDVMFLQSRFSEITTNFFRDSVLIVSCVIVLFFLHIPTAIVLCILIPFIALGLGRVGKRIAFFAEAWQRELAKIANSVLDIRERFSFIRSQKGEEREKENFEVLNKSYYRMIRRSILIRSAFAPMLEFIGFLGFAFCIYAIGKGIWLVGFTPVDLIQFFAALGVILRPLRNLGEQLGRFQETRGALKASLDIFREVEVEKDGSRVLDAGVGSKDFSDKIFLERFEGGYDGKSIIDVSNLEFSVGQSIAIIGPSGSGKSTLIKTIAGLIEPISWTCNVSWKEVVDRGSFVSQVPFLFDDTLKENLFYSFSEEDKKDEKDIWNALSVVNISDEVSKMPNQLETRVKAIGSNLSGGQIQRLVIARSILREKDIWLFDEATSAIDAKSERDITLRMIDASKNSRKALLYITHRLSFLDRFDQVWFVENGKVSLVGSHEELCQNDRYREFIRNG